MPVRVGGDEDAPHGDPVMPVGSIPALAGLFGGQTSGECGHANVKTRCEPKEVCW